MSEKRTNSSGADERTTPSRPIRAADGEELDELFTMYETVLVEFYMKGCTLCQSIEPVLGNVARATDVAVVLVNPREDLSLVDRFDVRSVPTLVLVENGEQAGRLAEGFKGADAIVQFVERVRGAARSATE